MQTTAQIAKHVREVHFGGNWTCVNLRDSLQDVTWQQAITQVYSFNTLATLAYHINYFVEVVIRVLEGGPLTGNDKLSFNHPPIRSEEDWQRLLDKLWSDAEKFAALIEQLPDSRLGEIFSEEKYGTYYRNLQGIVEHTHYHLGQIVIIKKILQGAEAPLPS